MAWSLWRKLAPPWSVYTWVGRWDRQDITEILCGALIGAFLAKLLLG